MARWNLSFGMNLDNPKIDGSVTSVQKLINDIPREKKYTIRVNGKIVILPTHWDYAKHFQGIAPVNDDSSTLGNASITASSTAGFFMAFTQQATSSDATVVSATIPNSTYFHAAGIQQLGDVLVVPLESSDKNHSGLVSFYDMSKPSAPAYMYTLVSPTNKSSAAAITRYIGADGKDWCLLLDYQYDQHQMFIWRAKAEDVPLNAGGWVPKPRYTGKAFDTGDQYQCFSLVTQTNADGTDTVYLLGFREDEEVWLWTIDTSDMSYGTPTYVDKYTKWHGSDFRNGTGLQIANSTTLRIYGTTTDPSGYQDDYHFDIYIYSK